MMDLAEGLRLEDRTNERWIKDQYDLIITSGVSGYCLVSLSLKNFLEYRHMLGHDEGEQAIQICYDCLAACLGAGECIVRLHSWYFNLLVKCTPDEDGLHPCAHKFHYAVRDTMKARYGRELYLQMGFYPITSAEVDFYCAQYYADLCRFGPHNLYPETNYDMYYVSFTDRKEAFAKLEDKVRPALEHGDFKLYLQPKVDLATGAVHSAEALMRWVDPVRGMIPLGEFLPGLEENGLIREVDLSLFDLACGYLEKWRREYGRDVSISFNLSRAYFNGPYFIPEYTEVFRRHDVPPQNIRIELLESVVLNDLDRLKPLVEAIYGLGFSCALDDFGSGFSSFDVLTNVQLSELKIDRSLFQNIDNPRERLLIKRIIDMAHDLGMVTVAEGVETEAYVHYLEESGCDFIQGFYFYRPMPVEEFEQHFILDQ